jgi:hypothetical protein
MLGMMYRALTMLLTRAFAVLSQNSGQELQQDLLDFSGAAITG